jgi:hypothetical protein
MMQQFSGTKMLQSYLASGARITAIGCDWFRMDSDWFNPSTNLKPHSHRIFRRHLFETFTELFVVFYISLKTMKFEKLLAVTVSLFWGGMFPVGTSAAQAKRRENNLERPLRRRRFGSALQNLRFGSALQKLRFGKCITKVALQKPSLLN